METQHTPDTVQWPKLAPWRFPREFKLAAFSAFIIGLVVHLYIFTNFLGCTDAMYDIRTENKMLINGRWALGFFSQFSSIYEMPVVLGVLSLMVLAVSCGLAVLILEFSHPVSIVIVSGILVTYPVVSCLFSFMFAADAYCFSILLNTLGVFFAKKYRFGWIAATACLTVGTAVYQSFIGYSVGLFLILCLLELLSGLPVGGTVKKGLKYIAVSLGSLILYQMIWKLLLFQKGLEPIDYRGMNDPVGLRDYFSAIIPTLRNYLEYLWYFHYLSNKLLWVQRGFVVFGVLSFVYLFISRQAYKSVSRVVLAVLGFAMLPFALNLIMLIAAGRSNSDALMIYAYSLNFVFALKLMEMAARQLLQDGRKKLWKAPLLAAWAMCAVLVWGNFCTSNAFYLKLHLRYENAFAMANRITARIEQLDEYAPDVPVVTVGERLKDQYYPLYDIGVDFGNVRYMREANQLLGAYTNYFIRYYIGMAMPGISAEQREALTASGFADTMPSYPAKDSVQYHDGVIIVKLNDGNLGRS